MFPLYKKVPGIVYLDSTATTLKPQSVIDAQNDYYSRYSANVFRGIYPLSEEATERYEEARAKIARFIGTSDPDTVIFTRNTTESLNLLAYTLIPHKQGRYVVSIAEHHANFVPWQQLNLQYGGEFVVTELDDKGRSLLHDERVVDKVITRNTVAVSITHTSNVLGTSNDVVQIARLIKRKNNKVIVIVDGAQAMTCFDHQVERSGIDALAFSGHKMFGPTGIGVLWAKRELLERLSPFLYGGEMIHSVSIEKTLFAPIPNKFESGTPHIAGAIGLGAAVDFITRIGINEIHRHYRDITNYAYEQLSSNKNITILGPGKADRLGLISFIHRSIHPHDLSSLMAQRNVCIRAGHHCAMPLHSYLKAPSSARMSFSLYTTKEDIDRAVTAISEAEKTMKL